MPLCSNFEFEKFPFLEYFPRGAPAGRAASDWSSRRIAKFEISFSGIFSHGSGGKRRPREHYWVCRYRGKGKSERSERWCVSSVVLPSAQANDPTAPLVHFPPIRRHCGRMALVILLSSVCKGEGLFYLDPAARRERPRPPKEIFPKTVPAALWERKITAADLYPKTCLASQRVACGDEEEK
ncbi:hypothetical protein B0H17DRAFT_1145509 [Mycena rosella]|uniref:Uncharacterized protein n=1 Tax=Mycena rosella TaxID=1033263 RepID=A0AAD7G2A8_MYCRO|nr:hypothetical protein B0H17DRAFT_1145509 [Mycena rosella]